MHRLRLVFLLGTVSAVISICGISAGAASASVFTLSLEPCNGDVVNLCWINSSKERFEDTGVQTIILFKKAGSANGIFKGVIGEESFTIECTGLKQGVGTNVIEQPTPLASADIWILTIVIEGCKLTAPAALAKKCVIPTAKETLPLTGLLSNINELRLAPTAGETAPLIQLTFSNNGTETCPATFKSSEHAISGFQVIKTITPETAETTKSGSAVAKSGLKLAGSAAMLTGEVTFSFTGLEDLEEICNCA